MTEFNFPYYHSNCKSREIKRELSTVDSQRSTPTIYRMKLCPQYQKPLNPRHCLFSRHIRHLTKARQIHAASQCTQADHARIQHRLRTMRCVVSLCFQVIVLLAFREVRDDKYTNKDSPVFLHFKITPLLIL